MLGFFIFDMARDPDLQAKYLKDPDTTMRAAGLTDEERALLTRGDVAGVAHTVASEVHRVAHGPTHMQPRWPGPRLRVTSIAPEKGKVGTTVDTTVRGSYFPADISCSITHKQGGTVHTVKGTVSHVVHDADSSMKVKFVLDAHLPTGAYDVEVKGTVHSRAEEDVLAGAFHVQH